MTKKRNRKKRNTTFEKRFKKRLRQACRVFEDSVLHPGPLPFFPILVRKDPVVEPGELATKTG